MCAKCDLQAEPRLWHLPFDDMVKIVFAGATFQAGIHVSQLNFRVVREALERQKLLSVDG